MTQVEFDQHFMIDETVIETIINEAKLSKEDVVLEIGPGKGAITKKILPLSKKVFLVEIDPTNEQYLHFDEFSNYKLIIGNALDKINSLQFNKIVSNLPYVIIEPLFHKLIKINFELCVFTITKNFYNVYENKNTKMHNMISSFFDIEYICDVGRESFSPPPKVDSCVIRVKHKKIKTLEDKIISSLFRQEDKLVKNALHNTFWNELCLTKKEAKSFLSQLAIPENILNKQFGVIANEEFILILKEIQIFLKKHNTKTEKLL